MAIIIFECNLRPVISKCGPAKHKVEVRGIIEHYRANSLGDTKKRYRAMHAFVLSEWYKQEPLAYCNPVWGPPDVLVFLPGDRIYCFRYGDHKDDQPDASNYLLTSRADTLVIKRTKKWKKFEPALEKHDWRFTKEDASDD